MFVEPSDQTDAHPRVCLHRLKYSHLIEVGRFQSHPYMNSLREDEVVHSNSMNLVQPIGFVLFLVQTLE